MPRKSRPKQAALPLSPIEAQQQALREQQERILAEIERKKRQIEEAPKIAEQNAKRRREEIVRRASRTEARFGTPGALLDPRHVYEGNVGAHVRSRKLRKHRRDGMWTFFVLCAILACVLVWVYYTVLKPL